MPATEGQLGSVDGDTDRYDAELRPELMRRSIAEAQDFGVEVDIWKIEGVDTREDAEMLSEQTRKGDGRENVKSVLLGRGASDEKVDHWLKQAAPVDGFIGFAIGRSIWGDALTGYIDGSLEREVASKQVATSRRRAFAEALRFVSHAAFQPLAAMSGCAPASGRGLPSWRQASYASANARTRPTVTSYLSR